MNKRKLAWDVAIQIGERLETSAPIWAQDVADLILPALDTWANEARLEALEQAAELADRADEQGFVFAGKTVRVAYAIRALKAAQHGEKELRKAQ